MGYKRTTKKNNWYDEECREGTDRRNRLRKQYLDRPTRSREEAYKTARKVARRICQKKKRQHANDRILLMQEKFTQNEAREA